ncbi:transposase [Thalassobacterium sedimentorum]|uniref:transposase n=1 Tax=Thalassobacterium sedimentorum TaxID=3041258 RepID=UPI002811C1F8|nr:transposase [Coraliomargarita sp. SDUM461004]
MQFAILLTRKEHEVAGLDSPTRGIGSNRFCLRRQNGRRAAIEPVIGHLKSDYRMARCFLKGALRAELNLGLAAAAWNLKNWINELLFALILWVQHNFSSRNLHLQYKFYSALRAA